jgi:aminoglycoside phosphotransferase (APT) family kinase protein
MATDAAEVSTDVVDRERLGEYLEGQLGARYRSFSIERLGAGQSCLTFLLDGDGWQLVLRRPPRGDLPPTAFDVTREFRIMSALRDRSGIPVPDVKLLCTDHEVIGANFYVMEPVDGLVLRAVPGDDFGPGSRAVVAADMVDVLADLHAVEWPAAGLRDFGNPGAYAERQLSRVQKLWARARFRDIPVIDRLGDLLRETVPVDGRAGIVHGDYKLDNVIVSPATGRVAAVVDWELSTIGDPLADLGYMTVTWIQPGDEADTMFSSLSAVTRRDGFPSREEIIVHYEERTGRSMSALNWYQALALWKAAVFMEGNYKRSLAGTTDDPYLKMFDEGVPALAEAAYEVSRAG